MKKLSKQSSKINATLYTFCIIFIGYNIAFCQNRTNLMSGSFETEDFLKNWMGSEKCCAYSIQRSDSVAKNGKYSLRFELRRNDVKVANGMRAELKLGTEKTPNVERWYRISYFLPKDYVYDPMPEILAQWHEMPDKNLGEKYRTPPLALVTQDDRWKFRIWWATDKVNTNKNVSGMKTLDLGKFETEKWTEWVFHLYFSHKDDGIVQIWKDGKLVVDYKGPNYYNDERGPYFKVGIYKSGWADKSKKTNVNNRVFFIDDVNVGNETYNFNRIMSTFEN